MCVHVRMLMLDAFSHIFLHSKGLLYKHKSIDQAASKLIKRIEMSLYRSAPSKENYADLTTLKDRIKAIVLKNEQSKFISTPQMRQSYVR